jgi:hypothetical protein
LSYLDLRSSFSFRNISKESLGLSEVKFVISENFWDWEDKSPLSDLFECDCIIKQYEYPTLTWVLKIKFYVSIFTEDK